MLKCSDSKFVVISKNCLHGKNLKFLNFTDPKSEIINLKCGNEICSKCKLLKYCSRDCQVKDWKIHKITCKNSKDEMKIYNYCLN